MKIAQDEPALKKGRVKPGVAIALIAATVILVAGLGLAVGYAFFWDTYDTANKAEHDFMVAKAVVNAEPDNVDARIALGWSFVDLGQYDQALEQYQNALKLDPANKVAKYNIALVKLQRKDYQGARADLEALQSEDPKYLDVRASLGYLYLQLGEYEPAVKEFEMVNAFYPGRVDILSQLAQSYAKTGDKAKAIAAYQEALKYDPNAKDIKNALTALN